MMTTNNNFAEDFNVDDSDVYHRSESNEVSKKQKPTRPSGQVSSSRDKPRRMNQVVLSCTMLELQQRSVIQRHPPRWMGQMIRDAKDLTVPDEAEQVNHNEGKNYEKNRAGHEKVRVLLFSKPECHRDIRAVVKEDQRCADHIHPEGLVAILIVDRSGCEGGRENAGGGGKPEAAASRLLVFPFLLHIRLV